MRRPYLVPDTYHHVILRGGRGFDFLHDDADRWECLKLLYHQNDTLQYQQWKRDVAHANKGVFYRPESWPERNPLVYILAFCIHDNHVHLLVKEIREGGLTQFMRRFPNSMSLNYNKKYGGSGSIFQGPYMSRIVESQEDLLNVSLYIMVKNTFERYPHGGLAEAANNFTDAYEWALEDNFSSFADYGGKRESPIIEKEILGEIFHSPGIFKKEAKHYIKYRQWRWHE